jgi:hypothetical protein
MLYNMVKVHRRFGRKHSLHVQSLSNAKWLESDLEASPSHALRSQLDYLHPTLAETSVDQFVKRKFEM